MSGFTHLHTLENARRVDTCAPRLRAQKDQHALRARKMFHVAHHCTFEEHHLQ